MRRLSPGLLLLCLLSAACELPQSSRPTPDDMTSSDAFPALDRRVVWEVVVAEIERAGLLPDREKTVESEGKFETHWVEHLQPFRFQGIRKKLLGRVEEAEGAPGSFRVRAIVWVQRNADLKNPLDSGVAIWQDIEPDESTTEQFLYRVLKHFD